MMTSLSSSPFKSMLKTIMRLVFPFALVLLSSLSSSHHSTVGQISLEVMEISGTVKELQFKNPHSWIQVLVQNDTGEEVEWSIEWGNPNNLMRQGYNPTTFAEGDGVNIRLQQHVSGAPLGEFVAAQLSNGTIVGTWD